ncbi:hypothetical protein HU200_033727 [Digitaria exilis]|uniref:Uncharacterized protein n=1 Tax=Digitaria exilis TaxID=1010633 RepID=A0A835ER28_9POAL|nr:hypothetical protein HU200_033727 [Digitaria exilis]
MASSCDGEAAAAAPLLEEKPTAVYIEGCPGCAIDREKAENTGIPYLRFFHIWIINLVVCLPISSIFPLVYFMISTSWAIGLILGPSIGGYLAQIIYLSLHILVFIRFPYFLPCLCITAFCFVILLSCVWLQVCLVNKSYSC